MKNYQKISKNSLIGFCILLLCSCSPKNEIKLGELSSGNTVSFFKNMEGTWGIGVNCINGKDFTQNKPAAIEIYQTDENISQLAEGYKTIKKSGNEITALAEILYGDQLLFKVNDTWSLDDSSLTVHRQIEVLGDTTGGFNSSIQLQADSAVNWNEVNCMVPGALYGDPTYDGDRSPGGTLSYKARRFLMREDKLSAPLLALLFKNGLSVAVLNPTPNGATTMEETRMKKPIIIDDRLLFGSLEACQKKGKPVEFGFTFPGTMNLYPYDTTMVPEPRWIRRYHPIHTGLEHNYTVSFLVGKNNSFSSMTKKTWRWAWNTLKPEAMHIDVEQVRTVLTEHLLSQAATIDGRTGIPFAVATFDTCCPQWNWTMTAMGFVSKNIECADQLLREGDRDSTVRGQKMRSTGLNIISSMIHALSTVPLEATGYDLATGKPWNHFWLAPWLRNATEDMRVLMRAYKRELALGREHPEWLDWVKKYVDWLILQQREDGSFPRRWKPGSNEVVESTGTTSFAPVPLLVIMTEITGDPVYLQSAKRAADYIWDNWGSHGFFVGGTSDNPNITDKEAGMLSLEAFLSLYENAHEPKWLQYAQVAADFTESWIWIWNVPMPVDANNDKLHWKKGVPTIGLQGISARTPGGVDEYLDWSASSYAKLYKYTNDEHYLDVARILLHNTKSMVALPGRLYSLKGIGWQQEHWSLGPGFNGRGFGGHQFWLPWISANHLYSINGLEELDPELFKELSE